MSWSVNAAGLPAKVKDELRRQFSYPLAPAPAGLADPGERETVERLSETISQCLETFDQGKECTVSANGHMLAGSYQEVNLSIRPMDLTPNTAEPKH
jgi:hypothetical protein